MKIRIIGCILAISLPMIASAAYDADRIKSFVSGAKGIFQVTGWKHAKNGSALVAITNLENVVISISRNQSSIYSYLPTSVGATNAVTRCMAFGHIGTETRTDKQKFQIADVINSAADGISKQVKINGVIFKASTTEVGGVAELSCHVIPSKT